MDPLHTYKLILRNNIPKEIMDKIIESKKNLDDSPSIVPFAVIDYFDLKDEYDEDYPGTMDKLNEPLEDYTIHTLYMIRLWFYHFCDLPEDLRELNESIPAGFIKYENYH